MTANPLRSSEQGRTDDDEATLAAREFLAAFDVDVGDMREAAVGMAALYRRLLTPKAFEVPTVHDDVGCGELVLLRDVEFVSVCACHAVPYSGNAHVAYLPRERTVGLSDLGRIVEHLGRAVQSPQRLAQRVAAWLDVRLAPDGVGVIVDADSCCSPRRGGGPETVRVLRGRLRDDGLAQREFLSAFGTTTGSRR